MDSYHSQYPLGYYKIGTAYMFFLSKWPAIRVVPDEKDIQRFAEKLERISDQPGKECQYEKRHIGVVIKKHVGAGERKQFQGILKKSPKVWTKNRIRAKYKKAYQDECKKRGYDGTINVLFCGMANGKRAYFETRFVTGSVAGAANDNHEQYGASVNVDMSAMVLDTKETQKNANNGKRHR